MDIIIGISGYTTTALGFVFLLFLLLTIKQNSLQRTILLLSSALGAIWASSSALQIQLNYSLVQHLSTETMRNIGWFLLLASALSNKARILDVVTSGPVRKLLTSLMLLTLILELSYSWLHELEYSYILLLHLAQSVLGLWLIEQLFRQTNRSARWTIKPLCLGLGMIYAYDFALFADGLLTRSIDSSFWYGRGWITLVALPFILLTARRVKHWSIRVYVSRDVIYHSTLLIVAGGYLLIMALTGYYIRYAGNNWGSMAQNIFFALSGLVLASLFLSEPLRRKLKVFITKHFYANKYEYREEWMKLASVLEEDVRSPYQIALKAMVRPFGCEYAMFAIQKEGGFKKQASYNLTDTDNDGEILLQELAGLAIEYQWIIDIEALKSSDAKVPFQYQNDAISNIKQFNYIIPIISPTGIKGVCLISKPKSTQSLNWEDRDLMWAISKQLSVYLNLYQTNQELAESQQFDTFNRMSAFLVHDLKNILAQLQLLSKNAKRHKNNPEFIDDAFDTIDSAVSRLDKVVSHLRNKRIEAHNEQHFDIGNIISQVCQARAITKPVPIYSANSDGTISITTNKERFSNVLSHIIQNAQEATTPNGFVQVTTSRQNAYYTVSIEDDGVGMTREFVDTRLFKPFDTTKGNSGMGIGAYDAKKMIEQLDGYIDVHTAPGKGSRFVIHIPVSSQ